MQLLQEEQEEVNSVFAEIEKKYGTIDVLVNNVGGLGGRQRFEEMETSFMRRVMALNFDSAFFASRAAIPMLKKSKNPSIINYSTIAVHTGGGPGYSIKGEFASNGFKNDLKHTRGVLSMARSMRPDSAGSQFFIMHQNAPHLDGDYAAFGKLIEGEDVLDKIAGVDTDYSDRPRKPQVMKTVTVETFGEEYPEPDKL